ncbi:MAG: hypothetical protein H0U65_15360 [Rubrobacter sp.]|nr:hypothetical protein [Rubrobacter sp.]
MFEMSRYPWMGEAGFAFFIASKSIGARSERANSVKPSSSVGGWSLPTSMREHIHLPPSTGNMMPPRSCSGGAACTKSIARPSGTSSGLSKSRVAYPGRAFIRVSGGRAYPSFSSQRGAFEFRPLASTTSSA